MWIFNTDYNKWVIKEDQLTKSNYDYLKQELVSTRLYSKCLSGATYLPINNLDNIYDILGEYEPNNWYIGSNGSQYSNSGIPNNAKEITNISSYDYYTKYLSEYGLTLKNMFTPDRLIKDSVNYIYVDIATTEQINNLTSKYTNLIIDTVKLLDGHRLLVKNQVATETLPFDTDPKTYFKGNYTVVQDYGTTIEYNYYSSDNGIYTYNNGFLTKTSDLSTYEDCIRYSVSVKLGNVNTQKQFHLSRLLNGYYPTSSLNEPVEFVEKHNWLLRNKVDYNNLFEINYYDVLKHSSQSYNIEGITYSIPERTIAIGEFGVILNTQGGISNIIANKYKVNLRSITQTDLYYWICGDDGILLKIRKHDFTLEKIDINTTKNLKSVSFFNNLKGVVVGSLNTILITDDGGINWFNIIVDDFESYYYNKVIFYSQNKIYIGGDNGVFIELENDISGWSAYKRRISKFIDDYEEYILVDNINDIISTSMYWGLNLSYSNQSTTNNKELLFIVTNDSKIIVYDINNSIPNFDFIYFELTKNYGDIKSIIRKGNSSIFYFSSDAGMVSINLNNFVYIGIDNIYSNTLVMGNETTINDIQINNMFDYNGVEILICGNTSLLKSTTYGNILNFQLLDPNFESRLKSKMLFVDYDMASKLNFFTDSGEYRLPSTATMSSVNLSKFSFQPLQNQTNWLTYWKDTQKTFEYYSNLPLDETTKVEISTTFSHSSITSQLNITSNLISIDKTNISRLAPTVLLDDSVSKFNGFGMTPITSPLSSHSIYLYDELMIVKVSTNYPVSIGDVISLKSSVVDSELVVNKIKTLNLNGIMYKYIYMFTSFNQNIINDLKSTNITLTNLNIYNSIDVDLYNRFNLHPISNGYGLTYSNNVVSILPKFNNITSYYNLATEITIRYPSSFIHKTISYTDGFLKFGYTPTYNLLDYLEGLNDINNPKFTVDKEYYVMPNYLGIPMQASGNLTTTNVYFDYKGVSGSNVYNLGSNRLLFGTDLKLEWESIFTNTFIDIILYTDSNYYNPGGPTYSTERLLVTKKYYEGITSESPEGAYVIEFHKSINFPINLTTYPYYIDILSRRTLLQISQDLQELNNIQRPKSKLKEITIGSTFYNYERELNYKISTDSYTKILLSDVDTNRELSAIIYTDYKNELAMNITRLDRDFNIKITDTDSYDGKLLILCGEKHELKDNEGVVLEFNGGTYSSQVLNQQYFGYQIVNIIDEYKFYINIPYINNTIVNDTGFVKYTKKDPFFNYEPIDIIDVGVDKKGKIAIELSIDNLKLTNDVYSLVNVDFNKYRFRLIDGLNIEILASRFPWILEAEVSGAVLGLDSDLIWYKGIWECGRWFSGTWISGTWKSGDWYKGTWNSKKITDNLISIDVDNSVSDTIQSTWYGGRWYDGNWNNGTWVDGRWYDGTWNTGNWYKGTWNDGTWNTGEFSGGIWVEGTWNGGIFNCNNGPSYWLDGKWYGGDFENGLWYNGIFEEKNSLSRFGTKAYNSRTANWWAGKWISGSFYSKMITDNSAIPVTSISHKYSIWKTGTWYSGDWYGGIAYNMDFQSGTWYGGILEEIQIIGINVNATVSNDNYITLNGEFEFNTGDEVTMITTNNTNPNRYKVITTEVDTINNKTKLFINISKSGLTNMNNAESNYRLVSRFRNSNWKSGIWTNGVYETGLWEGGIWYNGIFGGNWM